MAQVQGDCSLGECPLQKLKKALALPLDVKHRLAEAYAEQSQSDFRVYREYLQSAEECHRLHYLQMACEKIAKAYRLRDTSAFTEDDLYSHVMFSRFILALLKAPQMKRRFQAEDAKRRHLERYARPLSREIEKLAPAVDRQRTPANVEYPWISGETVLVPCRHQYANLSLLTAPGGRDFLKLIEIAIEDYQSITLLG